MSQWAVRCAAHTRLVVIWVVIGQQRAKRGLGAGGRSPSKHNHKGGTRERSSSEQHRKSEGLDECLPQSKERGSGSGLQSCSLWDLFLVMFGGHLQKSLVLSPCSRTAHCSETLPAVCISPKSHSGVCRRLLHHISRRNRRHHRLPATPKIAERSRKTQCICRDAGPCMRTGSCGPEEEGTSIPSQKDFTASVDLSLSMCTCLGAPRSPQHSGVTGCLALLQPTEPCTRTRSKIGCESSAEANSVKGTSKENTVFPLGLVTPGAVGDCHLPCVGGGGFSKAPALVSTVPKPGCGSTTPCDFT